MKTFPCWLDIFSISTPNAPTKSISGISTAALRLLLQHDWPGNVRELENAIERAVLLVTDAVLQVGSLPLQLSPAIAAGNDHSTLAAVLPLVEVERQALVHALEVADKQRHASGPSPRYQSRDPAPQIEEIRPVQGLNRTGEASLPRVCHPGCS